MPIAPVQEAIRERSGTTAAHVFLSTDSARHILDDHAERGLSVEDFAKASEVLSSGTILIRPTDTNDITLIGDVNGVQWRAVIKALVDEVYLVSFHRRKRRKK